MIGWLQRLADAILGRVPGKVGRFDTATRMMRDAEFGAARVVRKVERDRPYAEPEIDPLEELRRVVSADKSGSDVPHSLHRAAGGAPPIRSFSKEASSPLISTRQSKPLWTDEAGFTGITWPVATTNTPRERAIG